MSESPVKHGRARGDDYMYSKSGKSCTGQTIYMFHNVILRNLKLQLKSASTGADATLDRQYDSVYFLHPEAGLSSR